MLHNPLLAPTGRVKSFIENPDRGTLPASCTQKTLRESNARSFMDLMYFVQTALVTAAGVNIHLDGLDFSDWSDQVGNLYRDDYSKAIKADCVYLTVQDSMHFDPSIPGDVSIIDASFTVLEILLSGQDLYLDLSKIRPAHTPSTNGLDPSGPESFWKMFKAAESLAKNQNVPSFLQMLSTFNSEIKRGGLYKNGAVTTSMPIWHPLFPAYLKSDPLTDHPWLFKGAVVPKDWRNFPATMALALAKVNEGDLWLEKAIWSGDSISWLTSDSPLIETERLGHNVCREVLLESEGTCILLPVNLGQVSNPGDLTLAALEGMKALCEFQKADHQSRAGIYLSAKEDRQVGLGFIALANLLAIQDVTYADFVKSCMALRDFMKARGIDGSILKVQNYFSMGYRLDGFSHIQSKADKWALAFVDFFAIGANVADEYEMKRAFAIAPTASVSYRYKDLLGNTCAPEIAPPLKQSVETLSQTLEDSTIYHYGDVETAASVGYNTYFELSDCFQYFMDATGQGHAISHNVWEDMNYQSVERWAYSSLKSTYYRIDVNVDFMDKSDQLSCGIMDKDCKSCGA